jgi:uncharacterized protein (TIGR03435 family)
MNGLFPTIVFAAELTILAAYAQSPAAPVRKFEVASIKRCQDSDRGGGGDAPSPVRVELNCVTTADVIRMAYLAFATGRPNESVSPTFLQQPISGGPAWMNSDRYRIDAKAEKRANIEMLRGPMMQALLEDRFKLKLHWEAKQIDVFELTVSKTGAKLHPAKDGGCVVFERNNLPAEPAPGQQGPVFCGSVRMSSNGGFDILGVTTAELCRELTKYVDRDITDKTGIAGVFDVHLDLTAADFDYPGAVPDPTSTFTLGDGRAIAAAVDKLGLLMRPANGSTKFLVIDHLERPSEN